MGSKNAKFPVLSRVIREFDRRESFASDCVIRHRVSISGDTSPESPKSPRQRRHLQMCGSGENHLQLGHAQFAAKISVGKFGATVWELRRRTTICGSIGFALTSSFRPLVPARSK